MLTNNEIIRAKSIIKSEGGYREKELLKSKSLEFFKGDTWNESHKVIEVLGDTEEDGYHHGCLIDIVTKNIVG